MENKETRFFTPEDKAKYLKRLKEKSTDEKPVWISLKNPQLLPWAGMGGMVPQRGILVGVNYERKGHSKVPTGITVDFTRTMPINELPYASLPLSAVEIDEQKGEIQVDCSRAVEAGVGVPFNKFTDRSYN